MQKEYKAFECKKCKRTTIVLNNEIVRNRFLVCSHCSSKDIKEVKETDNLKECMDHASYVKEHGAIRQVR